MGHRDTAGRLKKAGLPYEPVKVRYVKRLPKNYCGSDEEGSRDSEVWYCDWDRTLSFKLGYSWLASPSDLLLFNEAALMYGYHVQKLTGLYDAGEDLRAGSKAEHQEQFRRMYLQVECLGGAFIQSDWPIKGRTTEDWNKVLGIRPGRQRQALDPGRFPHWRPGVLQHLGGAFVEGGLELLTQRG